MGAALALAWPGGAAFAQSPEAPLGFSIGPSVNVEHDSNVLRTAATGGFAPAQGDTISSYDLVGGLHETYGREEVNASASIGRVLYGHLRQFDYTQQDIRAGLRSSLPLDINVDLGATRSVQLAHFSDINSASRDVIAHNQASAGFDVPLLVRQWRGVLNGEGLQVRNSDPGLQTQDYNEGGASAGIRYAPTTGNHIDLLGRATHGMYPNATPATLLGRSYLEHGADLTIDWTFNGASRALGHAGFVRRRSQAVPFLYNYFTGNTIYLKRDFAGPAYDLTYLWQATAATRVTLLAARSTGAAGDNNYLAAVLRSYRVTPAFQVTNKLALNAYGEWNQRSYFSDIYAAYYGAGTERRDHTRNAGLGAAWTPWRWLQATLDVHRETRSSTIGIWSYGDSVASLGVQATFQ